MTKDDLYYTQYESFFHTENASRIWCYSSTLSQNGCYSKLCKIYSNNSHMNHKLLKKLSTTSAIWQLSFERLASSTSKSLTPKIQIDGSKRFSRFQNQIMGGDVIIGPPCIYIRRSLFHYQILQAIKRAWWILKQINI